MYDGIISGGCFHYGHIETGESFPELARIVKPGMHIIPDAHFITLDNKHNKHLIMPYNKQGIQLSLPDKRQKIKHHVQ